LLRKEKETLDFNQLKRADPPKFTQIMILFENKPSGNPEKEFQNRFKLQNFKVRDALGTLLTQFEPIKTSKNFWRVLY
jgi:hypothetical protein